MAIIKKNTNKNVGKDVEKRTLVYHWQECKLMQPPWKTVQKFLKRLKIDYHMTEQFHSWVYIKKKKQNPISQCSQQHYLKLPRIQKQLKCPLTDKWNKMWCVHTHTHTNGILLSHKTEWNFVICSNMDGLGGHYIKWSISEKEILYDITYMWNLKNTTNQWI